jgi:hypothetical protein
MSLSYYAGTLLEKVFSAKQRRLFFDLRGFAELNARKVASPGESLESLIEPHFTAM